MKTIPANLPKLRQLFATNVILPEATSPAATTSKHPSMCASHDFLVLSARPDLMPELLQESAAPWTKPSAVAR